MTHAKSLLLLLIIILFGCHLGPNYHSPTPPTPEDWKAPNPDCSPPCCLAPWWNMFNDPLLNELETQATENNPNLYVALNRVIEARALAGVSNAALYPHLNLNPGYSNTGILYKLYLPGTLPFPLTLPRVFRVHEVQYNLPLNLSYEIDLWGKLRGQYKSAVLSAEAQEEAFLTALLSLTTDLASSYFQLRSLDTLLDVLKETIAVRREGLTINQSRFNQGLVNFIDVSNATLQLSNVEAEYYDTQRQRNLQENAIAVLLGVPASDFHLDPHPLEAVPPCVPAGLPSDILEQRPDIAQAEREMASEHALIGVAYANFFPSLQLTGVLGFSSPDLRDFLSWKSRLWGMGANVGQTVFDAGKNCSNLEVAWARFREASGTYQQTVLVAFQEVEDALNNLELQSKQFGQLTVSVDAANQTAFLSNQRYKQGLVTYLEVVNSEQYQLDAKRNVVNLLGVRYLSTIQLIKALGGAWHCSEEQDDK